MGDGKALQMGTSHELGQNFAVPFNITFSNASGTLEHVWQTSWGTSTRLIGALVMGHGDDFGLRLPPALAPTQVVVMLVKDAPEVGQAAGALVAELAAAGHRVRLDDRTDTSFGRRSVAWELKGVPVRVEVGPRDLAEGNVTLVIRHRREKVSVALGALSGRVAEVLTEAAADLLAEATDRPGRPHGRRHQPGGGGRGGRRGLRPHPHGDPRARGRGPPGPARGHRALSPALRRHPRRAWGRRRGPRGRRGPFLLTLRLL